MTRLVKLNYSENRLDINVDTQQLLEFTKPIYAASALFHGIQDCALEITQRGHEKYSSQFRTSAIRQIEESIPLYKGHSFLPETLIEFQNMITATPQPPKPRTFFGFFRRK